MGGIVESSVRRCGLLWKRADFPGVIMIYQNMTFAMPVIQRVLPSLKGKSRLAPSAHLQPRWQDRPWRTSLLN